jgi:type IV secretion system protein VirB6
MGFIDRFLARLDSVLVGYVMNIFNVMASELRTIWISMLILLVTLMGIRIIAKGDFEPSELIITIFKAVIILSLTTQWSNFSIFVYDLFTNLPSEIGQLALSGGGSGNAQTITRLLSEHFEKLKDIGDKILEGASWMEFGKFMVYGLLFIGALLLTFLGVAFIALGKVATAVMLAVAPIFILMLMFKQTSNLFEGWLRTLCNYALLPLFVYIILGLVLFLGEDALTELETSVNGFTNYLEATLNYLLFAFTGFILLIQAPSMASSVGGGFSLSSMNALNRLMNYGKGTGKGVSNTAQKTVHTSRKSADLVKQAIKNARTPRK